MAKENGTVIIEIGCPQGKSNPSSIFEGIIDALLNNTRLIADPEIKRTIETWKPLSKITQKQNGFYDDRISQIWRVPCDLNKEKYAKLYDEAHTLMRKYSCIYQSINIGYIGESVIREN
jgi:hypothetical protein